MAGKSGNSYVVILDSDPKICKSIEKSLKCGCKVYTDPQLLLRDINNFCPIALFLDIKLISDGNGMDVIPGLRKSCPQSPIFIITDLSSQVNLVEAFREGADDFVNKPINPAEVKLRLKIRMEKMIKDSSVEVVEYGDICIDTIHRTISGPIGSRYASPIEVTLLSYLAKKEGEVVKKDDLKVRCWGQIRVTDNALHRKLHSIRSILRDVSDQVVIHAKYGVGFSLKISSDIKIAS